MGALTNTINDTVKLRERVAKGIGGPAWAERLVLSESFTISKTKTLAERVSLVEIKSIRSFYRKNIVEKINVKE